MSALADRSFVFIHAIEGQHPHDREGPEAWPYARHERDILAREDKKDQNGFVLAHGGDTLSDPGAYFFL